jgi:hypothetical protein
MSFQRLVKRATLARDHHQQIIFATSEELSTVRAALKDRPHTLRSFGDNSCSLSPRQRLSDVEAVPPSSMDATATVSR